MTRHTVEITDCMASPDSLRVVTSDEVRWCSKDNRSYKLTGLGDVFAGSPGQIDVPVKDCTSFHTVTGQPGEHYPYNVHGDPACHRHIGTPEIIIEN